MNIYKEAIISKLRFNTPIGDIDSEALYDLPLSEGRANLNSIAKEINKKIQLESEDDFVTISDTASVLTLKLQLGIIKDVIATRLGWADDASKASELSTKQDMIKRIIARKKDKALEDLSIEELESQL